MSSLELDFHIDAGSEIELHQRIDRLRRRIDDVQKTPVRSHLERFVGGAKEETIIARVGEGIVSTIGSAESYTFTLEKPFGDNWVAKIGYTYTDAEEVSPGTSSVALSNS